MASPSPELTFRSAGRRDWYSRSKTRSRSCRRDPRSVILHEHRGPALSNRPVLYRHLRGGVLQGVFDDVGDHLAQAVRVSVAEHSPAAGAVSIEMASPAPPPLARRPAWPR